MYLLAQIRAASRAEWGQIQYLKQDSVEAGLEMVVVSGINHAENLRLMYTQEEKLINKRDLTFGRELFVFI